MPTEETFVHYSENELNHTKEHLILTYMFALSFYRDVKEFIVRMYVYR